MAVTLVMFALAGHLSAAFGAETPEQVQARRDQLRIAVQEICPVSGQKLGSMGDPVKVTIGEAKEEVFLCCKGCLKGKIKPEHWATIHANIAMAQGKCPIMKKDLPKAAKWTVVKGEIVYVCCPPCIKKIAANPDDSLRQVDAYYIAYLRSKEQAR
jgi:hypothetical protein